MDPTWYMGHRLKIRWRSTVDRKSLGTKIVTAEESDKIYPWGWIHWKVDLINFAKSARTSQSESVWSRGIHHKLVLSCSPNPAGANPLPFWSSPSFLCKTRVHASPLSKYDGQEFKNELTWWLSWRARAYGTFGANHATILRWDEHYLQIDRNELPLDPHHLGVRLDVPKRICEPKEHRRKP
jgi:hypothetical protein